MKYAISVTYVVKAKTPAEAQEKVKTLVFYGSEETIQSAPPRGVLGWIIGPSLEVPK